MKINNFQGELTDISAKKEALATSSEAFCKMKINELHDTVILHTFLLINKNE